MREEKPSIQKILVPTDFSRDSDQALDYAAVLAEKFKAEILLAHVMESFTYSVSDTLTVVDHRKALKTIAQPLLDNLRKGLSEKGLSVKARLVDGVPYQEIIKV
ncbi:MAG TPA: universal stress protein, partial [Candidatus Manganitrophaceae bacterium]|nr:universal stress protein [Candidatus Manganitrophaceae bacterium]